MGVMHAPRLIPLILLLAILVGTPRPATAQVSRVAVEATFGGELPLSAFVHNAASLGTYTRDDGTVGQTSLLSDRSLSPGFEAGVGLLLSGFELRYRRQRFGWSRERQRCIGDRDVEELVNGEIDDAEVRYDCSIDRRLDISGSDLEAVILHHIGAGLRFGARALRGFERLKPYGVVAPGVTLTRFRDTPLRSGVRVGFHASAGGGFELELDRTVTVDLGLRYQLLVLPTTGGTSRSAGRAVATHDGVLGSVVDVSHIVGISAGVRINLR